MDETDGPTPARTPPAETTKRLEREAAALRENLRRRRAQAQARRHDPPPTPPAIDSADPEG